MSNSIFKKRPSAGVAIAVLLNALLVLCYPKLAMVTGVPRTDALRHLLVGGVAGTAWVAAWRLARQGRSQERALGLGLMVLPSICLVIVVVWAVSSW